MTNNDTDTKIPFIDADEIPAPIPIVPDDQVYLDADKNKLYAVVRGGVLVWKEEDANIKMDAGVVTEISMHGSVIFRED
jgi:outer membrane protein assembly factor BamB